MEIITGVFENRQQAESIVKELRSIGLSERQIGLVTPESAQGDTTVAVTDTERPGMGKAMGAAVGGAMGAAGGATLGLAAATLIIPGVGPVVAFGLLGAALLGGTGAAVGSAIGDTIEEGLGEGLPHEDVYIYEDALRHGRSLVIAHAAEGLQTDQARALMNRTVTLDLDNLREHWWNELRDRERSDYLAQGRDFETAELSYRKGFEAAQHAKRRGMSYDKVESELSRSYQEGELNDAFRRGYERGAAYQLSMMESRKD